MARLFRIEAEHAALKERVRADQVIFQWKKRVVERRILKDAPAADHLFERREVQVV